MKNIATGQFVTFRNQIYKHNLFLITAFIFGILYALISLVNHYNFRTYALDIGAYTNALYDYAHLHWNDSSIFKEQPENLLADHFDLYLIIFSPLSFIFKTYTLLIIQIFFILFGGAGVYKYFLFERKNPVSSILPVICFYLFFGIFSALSSDYHSNVIAAVMLPWFLFFVKQKRYKASLALLIFLLVSKENTSLWIAFVCLGLIIEYRKDKLAFQFLLLCFLISTGYFITVVEWAMPMLSLNKTYPHFNYSFLGNTPALAIKFLLTHPIESFKTLFINHTNNPNGDYVKTELHLLVLISGVYVLFLRPHFLIMLIPVYFQKMFNDNMNMWGINAQYSIEFAPVIIIGAFTIIYQFKNNSLRKLSSILVLVGCLISTIRIMDNTIIYTNKAQLRFYKSDHYKRNYDVMQVHKLLDNIPQNVAGSAQSPFVPHLALREKIYQFPIIKDATYIVYSPKESPYPLTQEEFDQKITELINSKKWNIEFKNDDLVILKKSGND